MTFASDVYDEEQKFLQALPSLANDSALRTKLVQDGVALSVVYPRIRPRNLSRFLSDFSSFHVADCSDCGCVYAVCCHYAVDGRQLRRQIMPQNMHACDLFAFMLKCRDTGGLQTTMNQLVQNIEIEANICAQKSSTRVVTRGDILRLARLSFQ